MNVQEDFSAEYATQERLDAAAARYVEDPDDVDVAAVFLAAAAAVAEASDQDIGCVVRRAKDEAQQKARAG